MFYFLFLFSGRHIRQLYPVGKTLSALGFTVTTHASLLQPVSLRELLYEPE